MKKILFTCTAAAILIMGCKKEDAPQTETPAYEFKNQNLQGEIEGSSWTFLEGEVKASAFTNGEYNLFLRSTSDSNACNAFSNPDADYVTFALTSLEPQLKEINLGTYNAVLYDKETELNVISVRGAIEILTVDTVARFLTGRAHIYGDEINEVNGNFTINICE